MLLMTWLVLATKGENMDRHKAYENQDLAIHNGDQRFMRIYYTPRQLKRMRKKSLVNDKRLAAQLGMTVVKAPF